MLKNIILFFWTFGLVLFILPKPVNALSDNCTNSYLTLINPIRSREHWSDKSLKPLEDQYTAVNLKNFPATWLLQYDTMFDYELLNYLKGFNREQEFGIFLEISEKLAKDARVIYPFGTSWYFPQAVFLSGYSQSERIRLIDRVMNEFKQVFGHYPKSLGSWWIDSFSLKYLNEKYGVKSYLIVADQKTTDNYGIWGQWWSMPYYPDRANVLIPGAGKGKLDLVVLQWAQRDPELAIGEGPKFSNNSVQANDYISLGKDTNYFKELVQTYLNCQNPIGQLTIGMETGAVSTKFHGEYINQLNLLTEFVNLKPVTMSQFYEEFNKSFPENPEKIIVSGKNTSWELSPTKRENRSIGEVIYYRQGTAFSDYFIPDKSGFLERDLTKFKTSLDPRKELLNFIPLSLVILAGIFAFSRKKILLWFLSTSFLFSSFGLLLKSGYALGWDIYYGPVINNLLLIKSLTVIGVYILVFLVDKYIKSFPKNYIFFLIVILTYGLDFLLLLSRVSYISGKYYFGILIDAYKFLGIRGNWPFNWELVNEDLPNYLASGLLKFNYSKIYDNPILFFIVSPLAHILVGFLIFQIYRRVPVWTKRIVLILLLVFYGFYLSNLIASDPRAVTLG